MKIEILQKFCPFSHRPAVSCLIPLTRWKVEAYPVLLKFFDLSANPSQCLYELSLPFQGPIQGFTMVQDLEKGAVRLFGRSQQGYFRYAIRREEKGIFLEWEKKPAQMFLEDRICISSQHLTETTTSAERLSLGLHKQLDWELVKRRQDLKELFPIWLKIADMVPFSSHLTKPEGTALLLEACINKIKESDKNGLESSFLNLFNAAFSGIFSPRLFDDEYQGLVKDKKNVFDFSPLEILKESAKLIRSLFFKEEKAQFFFLPLLPTFIDCGRFIHLRTSQGEMIYLEWSKKLLRRAIIKTNHEREVSIQLQKALKTFRLRTHLKDRGKIWESNKPIQLLPRQILFLDRFQK